MDTENKTKRQKPVEVKCLNCGKSFFKKVSEILKSNHDFCSRKCSTSYLNAVTPRRKKTLSGQCKQCNAPIPRRNVYCPKCRDARKIESKTLGEVICKSNLASRYCRVREHAKRLYGHIKVCEWCGYDRHVEICHLKPVSEFDLSTPVVEINSKINIAVLCPNCHWEVDKDGLLLF
jgi:hypothetical protein